MVNRGNFLVMTGVETGIVAFTGTAIVTESSLSDATISNETAPVLSGVTVRELASSFKSIIPLAVSDLT